jgi:uncharacterized membrane protein
MATTAWRFKGTEGADEAILTLNELDDKGLIDVQDIAVIRWPRYAASPQTQEHVTERGGKASAITKRFRKAGIDTTMVESVKGDIEPGTSALVLMSTDTEVEPVAEAFRGHAMDLMRSDLSVQQEDQLRAAFRRRQPRRSPPGKG